MAERGTLQDRINLFLKRAKHFNYAFIGVISVLFVVSLLVYKFFSLPVSPKLVVYIYTFQIISGAFSYLIAFIVRRKMFPVKAEEDPYWSYTAVRRYFWSYVLLSFPFGIGFLFFIIAGNLSVLTLGYIISICGLILFRPRRGDVI